VFIWLPFIMGGAAAATITGDLETARIEKEETGDFRPTSSREAVTDYK
jgi:hypothetical protein